MPQSPAGSAPQPASTKTLVRRAADGKLYVIAPTGAAVPVDADPKANAIVNQAETDLTNYFNGLPDQSLASGVKIVSIQVF